MYCQRCGALNDDDAKFCASCGAPCGGASPANPDASGPAPQPNDAVHDYLIPNIFAAILFCMPLGVAGIVFSALARDARTKGDLALAAARTKTAKTLFWLSIPLGVVARILSFFVLYFALYMLDFLASRF